MIGKLLGALAGGEIDRRDGGSGVKGALLGIATVSIVRRAGPLVLLVGGALLARKAYHRLQAEKDRRAAEPRPTV
jgi:hypothetical protein